MTEGIAREDMDIRGGPHRASAGGVVCPKGDELADAKDVPTSCMLRQSPACSKAAAR